MILGYFFSGIFCGVIFSVLATLFSKKFLFFLVKLHIMSVDDQIKYLKREASNAKKIAVKKKKFNIIDNLTHGKKEFINRLGDMK